MNRLIILIIITPLFLFSSTIYIPEDFETIQEGINTSSDGDTILISAGTYYESMIDSQGKDIIISGEEDMDGNLLTTIDGQGIGSVIFMFNGAQGQGCTVQNLIIQNSSGNAVWMYASNPIIRNCILIDNIGSGASAIWGSDSDPWIDDCIFMNNSTDIIFQNYSFSRITNCLFKNNQVSDSMNSILITQSSSAIIIGSEFDGNNINGGKIIFYGYNDGAYAEIQNCLFNNYVDTILEITRTNLEIENSEFKNNNTNGPLIIISEEEPVSVIIINTDFCDNGSSDPDVLIEGPWWDYYANSFSDECEGDFLQDCIDLSNIDFGMCDMILGVGWNGSQCEYFSGCDWIVDDIDYSDNLFDSFEECEDICECTDGEIIGDDPCNPMECYDGQWYEIIIDCMEDMGIPCEGGLYILPNEGECCSECILFGDINYDFSINILDVVEIVQLVLNNGYNEIVDINDDGTINVLDIIGVIQIILD